MDDAAQRHSTQKTPRGTAWLIAFGTIAALLVMGGFALIGQRGDGRLLGALASPTETPTPRPPSETPVPYMPADATDTPPAEAFIERQVVAPPTRTPTPTHTPTPTITPTPTETPVPSPRPTNPPEPHVEINWTQEEKNALAWMCYGEVGGFGANAGDACLSTISTVRLRYIRANASAPASIVDILRAPGQFNVRIETDRPSPSQAMNDAVEQYQAGMRGSCNGYYFFDSAPPQAGACVIYGYANQSMRFYNR